MSKLFEPFAMRGHTLSNRIAMAPMTRSRNPDGIANDLTAQYYRQRAGAGLRGNPDLALRRGIPLHPRHLHEPAGRRVAPGDRGGA